MYQITIGQILGSISAKDPISNVSWVTNTSMKLPALGSFTPFNAFSCIHAWSVFVTNVGSQSTVLAWINTFLKYLWDRLKDNFTFSSTILKIILPVFAILSLFKRFKVICGQTIIWSTLETVFIAPSAVSPRWVKMARISYFGHSVPKIQSQISLLVGRNSCRNWLPPVTNKVSMV